MTTAYEPGMIPQFELHDRAKKAMAVAGVTTNEMAGYVGIQPETMSRYLSGKSRFPVAVLRLIAVRTGVPFHWLETGEAPSPGGDGASADECAIRDSNPEPADLESVEVRDAA